MSSDSTADISFADLDLPGFLLSALKEVGYEKPSPIQQSTIPVILGGSDVVGMAQTGTGKTAAFALPILSKIDLRQTNPQALVLCPTRELAIQVAEAFQTYASHMKGFHVLPVYGGQDYRGQLRGLKRGAHVIVGTPGRLLDHLERKSLDLSQIKNIVLDEADEMLRMGFIDDVELILQKTPEQRQAALFSATMPAPIRKVAQKYLRNPVEVRIETKVTTNENIEQHYWLVSGTNKLDALTRILEVEDFDGMLIFVRTKTATVELADKLNARGFLASALNGDMNQQLRQRTVEQLKNGKLDIVVATDVAARGLDVERISHVLNYDIPYDDETYVHRIGRTGRAGRAGKAILFVAPRERRLLQSIEKTTRQPITPMQLPTRDDLIGRRSKSFKEQVTGALGHPDSNFFRKIVEEICTENEVSETEVATALVYLLQKDRPLAPPISDIPHEPKKSKSESAKETKKRKKDKRADTDFEYGMERYRLEVGHRDQVKPGEIVGAIANEADIEGKFIGQINIFDDYTTVDLPEGMPKEVFQILKKTRVRGKLLNLSKLGSGTNSEKEHEKEYEKKPARKVTKRKKKNSP